MHEFYGTLSKTLYNLLYIRKFWFPAHCSSVYPLKRITDGIDIVEMWVHTPLFLDFCIPSLYSLHCVP